MIDHDVRLSLQITGGQETFFERCFTSYDLEESVEEWPGSWRVTMAPARSQAAQAAAYMLDRNPVARCYVGGTLISTGYVDTWEPGGDGENGSFINIAGFGPLGQPSQDDVPLGWSPRNMTIRAAVESLFSKWDLRVVGDNSLNRSAITRRTTTVPNLRSGTMINVEVGEAGGETYFQRLPTADEITASGSHLETIFDDRAIRPRPGEKRTAFLRRFLAHHDLLCWETADGALFVGRPNYAQQPIAEIVRLPDGSQPEEGCVVSSRAPRRPGRQPVAIRVTGRVRRPGTAEASSRICATERDAGLISAGWKIGRIVVDDEVRDQEQATKKAKTLLAAAKFKTLEYEAEISGHGVGRYLLALDTIVKVRDATCYMDGRLMYVVRRSFAYNEKQGARVKIGCVRPDLWTPATSGE